MADTLRNARHKLQTTEPSSEGSSVFSPKACPLTSRYLLPSRAPHKLNCFLNLPCSQFSLPRNTLHPRHLSFRIYSDFKCQPTTFAYLGKNITLNAYSIISRLLKTRAFSLVLGIFPYYRETPNSTQTPVTSASPECQFSALNKDSN